MTEKSGLLLLPVLLASCQGHFEAGSGGPTMATAGLVPSSGLVTAGSWCDKSRGIRCARTPASTSRLSLASD